MLLEPPAYPERSHEIVFLAETSARGSTMGISHPSYHDWIDTMRFAETVAGYHNSTLNWTDRDEPIQARARFASASYFELHGVEPSLGRFYTEEEDRHGGERVAVLSHTLWQNRFGADPAALGSGVVLRTAATPSWASSQKDSKNARRSASTSRSGSGAAKMHPSHAAITRVCLRWRASSRARPSRWRGPNSAQSPPDSRQSIRTPIPASPPNVQSFDERRREFAIHCAFGAGRAQIIRSGLSESLGLAIAGGISGAIVAYWTVRVIRVVAPVELPGLANAGLDPNVFGYALIVAILTGLGCGVVPALSSLRVGIADALKQGGTRGGTEGGRLGRSLLIGEVALATVLLIAAALLIRTVHGLTQVDPGFRTEGVLAATLEISSQRYTREQREPFFEELTSRVQALPGVTGASVGLALPMEGSNWTSIFLVDDRPAPPRADLPVSAFNPVGRDYFATLGITLIEGRSFE